MSSHFQKEDVYKRHLHRLWEAAWARAPPKKGERPCICQFLPHFPQKNLGSSIFLTTLRQWTFVVTKLHVQNSIMLNYVLLTNIILLCYSPRQEIIVIRILPLMRDSVRNKTFSRKY